jgi:hypothetical protein
MRNARAYPEPIGDEFLESVVHGRLGVWQVGVLNSLQVDPSKSK